MNTINQVVQKIARGIFKVFYVVSAIAFAVLLSILFYNVLSRNILGGAVSWIEEISSFIFTWMMFMGISIGVYYKKHLGVDFLLEKYPVKIRKWVSCFAELLTLITFVVLAIYGFKFSFSTMRMYSPILNIPYGLVYMCVPISGVLSAFYCVAGMLERFSEKKKEGES